MRGTRGATDTFSEIIIDPQPDGLRAGYLIETHCSEEAREIEALFSELEAHLEIRQLSEGRLLSYAVKAHESDAHILQSIQNYIEQECEHEFASMHAPLEDYIYQIVDDLCRETGSTALPIPRCNICGKAEPFPRTVISLAGEDGSVMMHRNYCASCTAQAQAPSNKEFILTLLSSDERDFGRLGEAELVRHPSRKRPIRFRVV